MTDVMLSPRLCLRLPRAEDSRRCASLYADPKVMGDHRGSLGGALGLEDAQARFNTGLGQTGRLWALERRRDHRLIGMVELEPDSTPRLLLEPESWGEGHATEVFWLLLTSLENRWPARIEVPRGNPAARRVAERCGYAESGLHGDTLRLAVRSDQAQRLATLTDYYRERHQQSIQRLHDHLGIPLGYGPQRQLPTVDEARALVAAGEDVFGRPLYLESSTRDHWQAMQQEAESEGVVLQPVSGFRSVYYQADLIRRKLDSGRNIDAILAVSAAPGFSEHHSGRALDLTTTDSPALEECFEETPAFRWLCQHGRRFGFAMSYPRDNPHGLAYEPWHWARDDPRSSS